MGGVTVVPARVRQEPVDMAGFDAWQDWEGLQDASKATRAAWGRFQKTWRAARRADFAPVAEAPLDPPWFDQLSPRAQLGARRARVIGAMFGYCVSPQRRRPLTEERRTAFVAWRKEVIRRDPDLWWSIWKLVDGEPLEEVSAWKGCDKTTLLGLSEAVLCQFCRMLYTDSTEIRA